jgi:hypothetical protein|tara:strand:+ start:54 stop:518 length:465 start_codon:yes stop_codon:yes gene_type:complete
MPASGFTNSDCWLAKYERPIQPSKRIYISVERFSKSKLRKPIAIPIPLMRPPLTLMQDFGIETGIIHLSGFIVDDGTYNAMEQDRRFDQEIADWWSDTYELNWGTADQTGDGTWRSWKGAISKYRTEQISPNEQIEIQLEFKIKEEKTTWDWDD